MRQISLINPCWQKQLLLFFSHSINNPPSRGTAALHPSTSGELALLSIRQSAPANKAAHLADLRTSANGPTDPDSLQNQEPLSVTSSNLLF